MMTGCLFLHKAEIEIVRREWIVVAVRESFLFQNAHKLLIFFTLYRLIDPLLT